MNLVFKVKNAYIENIMIVIFSGIIAGFFLLKSPLHPWIQEIAGTDSSIYMTVALMMEKGAMPYKDTFDHKGPLIYIINWLGIRISGYGGVWVIEFLFLMATFFVLYKIARLLCKRSSGVIVTLVAVSLLFKYFEQGNFTEEYAMLFIATALFIFLDYLKNSNISKLRLVVCGLCLGGTLLLRPNMISVWVVMCLAIFVRTVIAEQWVDLRKFVMWFVLGMVIIVVPIIVWLGVNKALGQFWQDYIVFNQRYISKEGGRALFSAKWSTFFTFFNTAVYISSFMSLIFLRKSVDYFLNVTYSVYMIVTILFMCLSGMAYGHYGMILVPAVTYPLALLFSEIEKIEISSISKILVVIVSIYFLNVIIVPDWMELVKTIPAIYDAKNDRHDAVRESIVEILDSSTSDDDAISVYGSYDIAYIISDRKHATRYSYQFPIGTVMPEIMDDYMAQLQEELPKIIVVGFGYHDTNIVNFLSNNGYYLLWSQNGEEMNGILIYSRNS